MKRDILLLLAIVPGVTMSLTTGAEEPVDEAELERQGAVIGDIILKKENIFDLSNPAEDRWLYRLANRFHIVTRDKTIRKQLLVESGDPYSARLVAESERILRRQKYLYTADIKTRPAEDGNVDLVVHTRDIWSLGPELSYSRAGGENKWRVGLEEDNLLGRGQLLRFTYANDVDRSSKSIELADNHVGRSWVSLAAKYSDNSDGDTKFLAAVRPFYALDTRWAGGGTVYSDDRRDTLYVSGIATAEYQHERDYATLFGGWSRGIRNGRVRRWTAGFVYDDNQFDTAVNPSLPAVIPPDRKLVYPYIGFELVEDEFVESQNRNQIAKTEDFQMGLHVSASLGWADTSIGADRDALLYRARATRGFGKLEETALLLEGQMSGRVESGNLANALLSLHGRFYHRQSERRLFFASITGIAGEDLDLDNPLYLDGDTGIRGYPLRYRSAESSFVATIEQRYFTDWYPWRLVRVGGAIFADAGRAWGSNPLGEEDRGWLTDVGFGLRFSPTRFATTKVFHLDVAFPLNGDASIDSVQISFGSKQSF